MDPWEGLFYTYHQIEMVCVPTTTTLIPIASFNKSLVRDFANNKMSIKIHMLLPLPPLLWQPAILIEDTRSSHTCTYKNDNIHHHSVAYSFYEAAKQTDSRVCGWQSDIPKIILWWTKGRIKWGAGCSLLRNKHVLTFIRTNKSNHIAVSHKSGKVEIELLILKSNWNDTCPTT